MPFDGMITLPPGGEVVLYTSASGIESFGDCHRKAVFEYVEKVPKVQNASAALGDKFHKYREIWLRDGIPPPEVDFDEQGRSIKNYAGQLARAGLENLPPPHLAEVEQKLAFFWPVDNNKYIRFSGRIDFWLANQGSRVWGTPLVPVIGDHKSVTAKSVEYIKTSEYLLHKDAQGAIYGMYSFLRTGAEFVDLFWAYAIKSQPPRPQEVRARMSRAIAHTSFEKQLAAAKQMLPILQPGTRAKDVEPNLKSCQKYGGCPFLDICPITITEKVGTLMTTTTLDQMLASKLGNGSAAPPASTPSNGLANAAAMLQGAPGVGWPAIKQAPADNGSLESMLAGVVGNKTQPAALATNEVTLPLGGVFPAQVTPIAPQVVATPIAPRAAVTPNTAPLPATHFGRAARHVRDGTVPANNAAQEVILAYNEFAKQPDPHKAAADFLAAYAAQGFNLDDKPPVAPLPVPSTPVQGHQGVVPPDAAKPNMEATTEEEKTSKRGKKSDYEAQMLALGTQQVAYAKQTYDLLVAIAQRLVK